jgi:hypothetical protein
MMKSKKVFTIVTSVLVFSIAVLWIIKSPTPNQSTIESGGQVVGGNAIYVDDCPLGTLVPISYAKLQSSGFVVIHEDSSNKPGKILGASQLLAAGENTKIPPVSISRMSKDKERLYAIVYLDDGNGAFDFEKDKPAIDSISGESIMMFFNAASDAGTPGVVNP